MAPEMAQGDPIDYRADIYELGIVLYQMLTGHVPFTGNSPYAIVIQHIQKNLPLIHASNPNIPPAVDDVLQKATAKRPAERFTTAGAMAQALRQAIQQLPSQQGQTEQQTLRSNLSTAAHPLSNHHKQAIKQCNSNKGLFLHPSSLIKLPQKAQKMGRYQKVQPDSVHHARTQRTSTCTIPVCSTKKY